MKIGFDAKRAFHNRTGLGNYSRDLIQGLINLAPENSFYLFNPKKNSSWSPSGNSHEIIQPKSKFHRRFHTLWRRKKISSLCEELDIEIYHGLSHELPLGIENQKCKTVVSIHDLIFERFPKQYKGIDRASYRLKIKHACQVANAIVCVSEFTASELIDLYSVDPEKIEIIWPSIHDSFYSKEYVELSIPNLKLGEYYLSVGTFELRKQQKELLNILRSDSKRQLVLVGKENSYAQELRDIAEQEGYADRLFLMHKVDLLQLKALYKQAKAFVYASSFEGFGMPIAEAMAVGCPVIIPDLPLYQEVTAGKAFFYPDRSWDVLVQLLKELEAKDLFTEKIAQAKEVAKRYTVEQSAEKTLALYKSLPAR